jgi:hypothetical protein
MTEEEQQRNACTTIPPQQNREQRRADTLLCHNIRFYDQRHQGRSGVVVDVGMMCRTTYYKEDDYPTEQLVALEKRQRDLHENLERPISNTIDTLPTGCGIISNLQLIGIFPTARWLNDPTMPPDVKEMFGGTPFFALGDYRVAFLDIKDASDKILSLKLVVNSGVEGMKLGYWGCAFLQHLPHSCVARFESTGDMETTIIERPAGTVTTKDADFVFQEYQHLEFASDSVVRDDISTNTQLEKLLGVAVDFLLTQVDWNGLPQALLEIRDTSPRAERQLARRRASPKQNLGSRKFIFDD